MMRPAAATGLMALALLFGAGAAVAQKPANDDCLACHGDATLTKDVNGKPLSLKVQSAIQVVGIVLLGGLFLFVTYNDLHLFVKP